MDYGRHTLRQVHLVATLCTHEDEDDDVIASIADVTLPSDAYGRWVDLLTKPEHLEVPVEEDITRMRWRITIQEADFRESHICALRLTIIGREKDSTITFPPGAVPDIPRGSLRYRGNSSKTWLADRPSVHQPRRRNGAEEEAGVPLAVLRDSGLEEANGDDDGENDTTTNSVVYAPGAKGRYAIRAETTSKRLVGTVRLWASTRLEVLFNYKSENLESLGIRLPKRTKPTGILVRLYRGKPLLYLGMDTNNGGDDRAHLRADNDDEYWTAPEEVAGVSIQNNLFFSGTMVRVFSARKGAEDEEPLDHMRKRLLMCVLEGYLRTIVKNARDAIAGNGTMPPNGGLTRAEKVRSTSKGDGGNLVYQNKADPLHLY